MEYQPSQNFVTAPGSGCRSIIEVKIFTRFSQEDLLEFTLFPFSVKVCFAMTRPTNKVVGQCLKLAGVDSRKDCFSYGRLYVAYSRVSSFNDFDHVAIERKCKTRYKDV